MNDKSENPYDLNSTNFNPDMYLQKLQKVRQKNLTISQE